jgi:hypothetical protein
LCPAPIGPLFPRKHRERPRNWYPGCVIRVLITLSPRIYREAVAFSLGSRPDIEARAASPEEAELELAGFRPHLLVHNDADGLGPGATAGVLCHIEIPYSDGINVRVTAGQTVSVLRDMSTEDLLRTVDVTATVGGPH